MAATGAALALAALVLSLPSAAIAGDGAKLYAEACGTCHQAGGVGVPGQFPKLASRVAAIAATPDGRRYLGVVVLYGINGKIMVEGKPNMGVMPPQGRLADRDIAEVLNYLARQGVGKMPGQFTATEITGYRRKPTLSAVEVKALRAALEAKGVM